MSLWNDFVGAVSSTVDTIGDVLDGTANAVGELVSDVVETVGNSIQDLLNAVGDAVAPIPGAGPVLRVMFRVLGGIVGGSGTIVSTFLKGLAGIFAGLNAGVIRILGGLFIFNWTLVSKGIADIVSSIVGAHILLLGESVSAVQKPFLNTRSLTKEERAILRRVFYDSIALRNIRIVDESSGVFDINDRKFVLGNTIYMKQTNRGHYHETLIHECVHVWQFQNLGARYTSDALSAQFYYKYIGESAYRWQNEFNRGNMHWWEFNLEAQASFMEDVWKRGSLVISEIETRRGAGCFYDMETLLAILGPDSVCAEFNPDGTDYTLFAHESIATMRGRLNLRLSGLANSL